MTEMKTATPNNHNTITVSTYIFVSEALGSRGFEIGSCREHGFFYFVAESASVDCFCVQP